MPRREKNNYHFIYKTTNLITGRFYIGMHSTNNLEDDYLGSGKILGYSVKKYGEENHKVERLEFFEDRKKLADREAQIVNELLLKDPSCMNLTYGGFGSWLYQNSNSEIQKSKGDKANQKMKWLYENDSEWVKKVSINRSKGQKESYKNGRINNPPDWTGKNHTEKSKEKMSKTHIERGMQKGSKNSQFGTCFIFNKSLKKCKRIKKEDLHIWKKEGWALGAKFKW